MEKITAWDICAAAGGSLLAGGEDSTVNGICTDSRYPAADSLFVPLVGERFDGHDYLNAALQGGCSGCLTARTPGEVLPGRFYIRVEDTLKALGRLAAWYGGCFSCPKVAITGSVGKTTTKEMVAAVLAERGEILKTIGNLNNHIGLPRTLLGLEEKHWAAVLEMGMNHSGEIDYLTNIARPDIALITNIGDAHIEHMGSRENTLKAKSEIFHGMTANGLAVLNGDDPLLRTLEGKIPQRILWCGEGEDCPYRAKDIQADDSFLTCTIVTPKGNWRQTIPAPGRHMVYPALMAAAVGEELGLTQEEISRGISRFSQTGMRMLVSRKKGVALLNDAYNANPQSVAAGLETLSRQPEKTHIALLGDMLELGERSPALHREIGFRAGESGVHCLITVGEQARHIAAGAAGRVADICPCGTPEEAKEALRQRIVSDTAILVKASRGMHFEALAAYIEELRQGL